MLLTSSLLPRLLLLAVPLGATAAVVEPRDSPDLYLNLTTVTGRNGISVLECWQLDTPFSTIENVTGAVGAMNLGFGNMTDVSYTIVPVGFVGGFVWFLNGPIHITLPNTTGEAWISGGKHGLVYAEDTADVSGWGHDTLYPPGNETAFFALPPADGQTPGHTVLHDGACSDGELSAL
ncbi:hypothetical protein F4780DRAFT_778501 [Xylariomycetidae sp. FL0641]|nr:hypothetical protein F4780DRAFT_778501 [Xylariomycetidae sp. FL0641]